MAAGIKIVERLDASVRLVHAQAARASPHARRRDTRGHEHQCAMVICGDTLAADIVRYCLQRAGKAG
ncbi:hypothetical protein L2218_26035, partial [Xanthomonas perforans]|uniref:hypothetical protein n=1 Tax=Xanthomonas perforans TaxID=442694 RepID=UPI001F4673D6